MDFLHVVGTITVCHWWNPQTDAVLYYARDYCELSSTSVTKQGYLDMGSISEIFSGSDFALD